MLERYPSAEVLPALCDASAMWVPPRFASIGARYGVSEVLHASM
jgi:hypothetical protein